MRRRSVIGVMGRGETACISKVFALVIGSLLISILATSGAAGENHGHTIAANDDARVSLMVEKDWRYLLEVRDTKGALLWQGRPSSSSIRVSLKEQRIVIFTMTSNEGRMRHGKPGPVSGAKIYSLRGKMVGTLPKGCYDGKFIGRIFIAKRIGGGVAAYQVADAKEVWLNKTLSAGDIRDSGAGLVILTKYDHKLRVYHNAVLDAASGKVMYKLSGEKGERVSILLATRKRYITLKGKAGNRGAADWSSDILSAKGKSLGRIHWKGLPHTASFSPDGNTVGAVCYSPPRATGDAETKKVKWTAYIYTLDGKILAERQVGECEWKELATQMRVSHTLRFDSDGLSVTQKRVFSPLRIKSSRPGTSNTKTVIKLRTPRETVEAFFDHVKKGNADMARKLTLKTPKGFKEFVKENAKILKDVEVKFVREVIEKDKARVFIKFVGKKPGRQNEDIDLVLQNGRWLITHI
jgi:hypothetical protein